MKHLKSLGFTLLYLVLAFISVVMGYNLYLLVLVMKSTDKIELMKNEALLNEKLGENTHIPLIIGWLIAMVIFVIIIKIRRNNFFSYCNFNKTSFLNIFFVIFLSIPLNFIINITIYYLQMVLKNTQVNSIFEAHDEMISKLMDGNVIFIGLAIGVLVPIFEETLFRGLIQSELNKTFNTKIAIIIQALLFGLYHFQPLQIFYASIAGLIFGISRHYAKSIFAPISMHITFNSTSYISSILPSDFENLYFYIFFISIFMAIVFGVILLIRRKYLKTHVF